MEIQKPIFIIGVPRTGTTLLYNMLCMHPKLAWFSIDDFSNWTTENEKALMKKHFLEMEKKNNKIPVSEESLFVFGPDWEPGIIQTKVHPDLRKTPIEGEYFWRKYFGDKYITNITDEKKQQIIVELKNIIQKQQKLRFLSKAPQNTMRMFAIQKIFPDAKFVNVIRDPRATINSMQERHKKEGLWDPGIEILDNKKYQSLDVIGRFAWRYKEMTDEIYKFANQNKRNFITVNYENLISKSEKLLTKILEFCELDIPDNFQKMIPEMRGSRDNWKNNMTAKQQKNIWNITKKSMKRMNYSYKQGLRLWLLSK